MSHKKCVVEIFEYPVKSMRGNSLEKAFVTAYGLDKDRTVAVIDADNKIVTGREYPRLLSIESRIDNLQLKVSIASDTYSFSLPNEQDEMVEIKLFRNTVSGILLNSETSSLVSKFLDGNFRMIYMGKNFRPISPKHGGREGEHMAYADSAPVHLLNLETLKHLNSELSDKVSVRNFRPNIVIDGYQAFEENTWDMIQINECMFRVQEKTQRCVFTTIDPDTLDKNEQLEPLATIAKTGLARGLGPAFGINLVPITEGFIAQGDIVKVIKKLEK
ncbi:MOSC domain-containing protein [Ulvibacterium marinum]|uniref:MOSC domain-containing protein n=1 Tax=Ulvibacterium marinum TaxID=2419782 RepID=A0A3B0C030_9FLAO|nr:MOSC N-terminal beta barrel domain-containing protein [Ulvibacterium marinum]RKN78700.1 MOSC domain-containing protein [Ulvibacterium marinum]